MNILVSSNKKYLKPLGVMLYSLSKNTNSEHVNVYFVNVTLSNKDIVWLKKHISSLKNFNLYVLEIDKTKISHFPLLAHISIETYSRLFLMDIIPSELEKILWLDADMIINNNIDEFYNQNIENHYAAVCESINKESYKILERLNLNENQKYFNAGIILFNLKKLREDFDKNYFIDYASKNFDKIVWLDQDILNATIGHNCIYCDYKKYNMMHFSNASFSDEEKNYINNNTVVFHYIGKIKPWNYNFDSYTKKYWLKVAKKSKLYSPSFFFNDKILTLCYEMKKKCKNIIKCIIYVLRNALLKLKCRKIKILSPEYTISYIVNNKSSATRFGDGEMLIMDGEMDIGFQSKDENLSKRLNEIIVQKPDKKMLICIPKWLFKKTDLRKRTKKSQKWCKHYLLKHFKTWCDKVNLDVVYGDTSFNRNYIGLKNKSNAYEMFKKLKTIWENRDVCFVEGDMTYLGVGNDLFDNAKSIKRIIAPAKNAFKNYDKILCECKKVDKGTLFLIALGPTATVLAYDLYNAGYQAIDIGHIDIEYEWCKMKATEVVQIKNKFTNEAGSNNNILRIDNPEYENQIIAKIK
jgi:glycosyltransferase family protein